MSAKLTSLFGIKSESILAEGGGRLLSRAWGKTDEATMLGYIRSLPYPLPLIISYAFEYEGPMMDFAAAGLESLIEQAPIDPVLRGICEALVEGSVEGVPQFLNANKRNLEKDEYRAIFVAKIREANKGQALEKPKEGDLKPLQQKALPKAPSFQEVLEKEDKVETWTLLTRGLFKLREQEFIDEPFDSNVIGFALEHADTMPDTIRLLPKLKIKACTKAVNELMYATEAEKEQKKKVVLAIMRQFEPYFALILTTCKARGLKRNVAGVADFFDDKYTGKTRGKAKEVFNKAYEVVEKFVSVDARRAFRRTLGKLGAYIEFVALFYLMGVPMVVAGFFGVYLSGYIFSLEAVTIIIPFIMWGVYYGILFHGTTSLGSKWPKRHAKQIKDLEELEERSEAQSDLLEDLKETANPWPRRRNVLKAGAFAPLLVGFLIGLPFISFRVMWFVLLGTGTVMILLSAVCMMVFDLIVNIFVGVGNTVSSNGPIDMFTKALQSIANMVMDSLEKEKFNLGKAPDGLDIQPFQYGRNIGTVSSLIATALLIFTCYHSFFAVTWELWLRASNLGSDMPMYLYWALALIPAGMTVACLALAAEYSRRYRLEKHPSVIKRKDGNNKKVERVEPNDQDRADMVTLGKIWTFRLAILGIVVTLASPFLIFSLYGVGSGVGLVVEQISTAPKQPSQEQAQTTPAPTAEKSKSNESPSERARRLARQQKGR